MARGDGFRRFYLFAALEFGLLFDKIGLFLA